jgi:hypothetical protein
MIELLSGMPAPQFGGKYSGVRGSELAQGIKDETGSGTHPGSQTMDAAFMKISRQSVKATAYS